MARLIDADALGICKANRNVFDKPEYADGWNSAVAIVEDAPTVDAVEVVHGEWIEYTEIGAMNNRLNCSVCNWKTVFCVMGKRDYNFCPNCGAKMDGKGR